MLNCFNNYKLFISSIFFILALFVTFYTDTKYMLISRLFTLYSVPICLILAYLGYLPISLFESFIGAIFGYLLLWTVSKIALRIYKIEALGQGDIDLLCFIGSFIGPIGCWFSLLIGSITGSVFGIAYALLNKSTTLRTLRLPFGAFLTIGALFTLFYYHYLILFFNLNH